MKTLFKRCISTFVAGAIGATTLLSTGSFFTSAQIASTKCNQIAKHTSVKEYQFANGWTEGGTSEAVWALGAQESGSLESVYCIQPGGHWNSSSTYLSTYTFGEDGAYWDEFEKDGEFYNKTLEKDDVISLIAMILSSDAAYTGAMLSSSSSLADRAAYIATQTLIWEVIVGERSLHFYNAYFEGDAFTEDTNGLSWDDIKVTGAVCVYSYIQDLADKTLMAAADAAYESIVAEVQAYFLYPSFANKTYTFDGTDGTITLTDTNKVLSNFNVSCSSDLVKVSTSGNTLTLTYLGSGTDTLSKTTIKFTPKADTSQRYTLVLYNSLNTTSTDVQATVKLSDTVDAEFTLDPTKIYVKASATEGTLSLKKVWLDQKGNEVSVSHSGIKFKIEEIDKIGGSTTGWYTYATTDSKGNLDVTLTEGYYRVTEITSTYGFYPTSGNKNDNGYYYKKTYKDITITAGETNEVSFYNAAKQFRLNILKYAEDYELEGTSFEIMGTNILGEIVDEIVTIKGESVTITKYIYDDDGNLEDTESTTYSTKDGYSRTYTDYLYLPAKQSDDDAYGGTGGYYIYEISTDGATSISSRYVSSDYVTTYERPDGTTGTGTYVGKVEGTSTLNSYISTVGISDEGRTWVFKKIAASGDSDLFDTGVGLKSSYAFTNALKSFTVTAYKLDSVTNTTTTIGGNCSLAGAVYGLYVKTGTDQRELSESSLEKMSTSLDENAIGKEFTEKGFVSTSTDSGSAEYFSLMPRLVVGSQLQ